jgi:uncharacterized protein
MLIADTGRLVAMLNAKDKHHEACTALFRRFRGPVIVPAPIVTKVAYFLQIEPGPAVEAAFLDALARSELIVEPTTAQDFARVADLVRQYADFPLGTADASVIAVPSAWLPDSGSCRAVRPFTTAESRSVTSLACTGPLMNQALASASSVAQCITL